MPLNTLVVFALTAGLAGAQVLGVNHYGFGPDDPQMLRQLSPSSWAPMVPLRMTFYWHNVAVTPDYYDTQVAAAAQAGVPLLGILGYSSLEESSMPADFDFTEISPFDISWDTEQGPLPWGSDGVQGTAKYLWNAMLEDGRTYPRVVALESTAECGFVHGAVRFQVPSAHSVVLWAKVGFPQGVDPGARVNFSVTYLNGTSFPSLAGIAKAPDGTLATLTADISKLAGTALELFFNVDPIPGHPVAEGIWQSAGILVDGVPLAMSQVVGGDLQSVINYPPKDPDAFAAYAANMAGRYPQVEAWEVWNEPNTSFFWRPAVDAAAYTTLLKKTYRAVKAANPNARIILGGLSPGTGAPDSISPPNFVEQIYRNGGGSSFDAVAFHAYGDGALEDWLAASLLEIRSVMDANGDMAKRVWITEMGCYTEGPGSVSEAWQSQYLLQARAFLTRIPYVQRVYWYTLRDADSSSNPESNYGLFRADGTPKPAVSAFAAPLGN